MRVLGVDPGTVRMGYGILDGDADTPRCLEWGCLMAAKAESVHLRLYTLYRGLAEVVERWRPDHLAVEEPFVAPARGAKSGIVVGQAQAVALLLAAEANMEVHCYLPSHVKQALADSGAGTKTQVQRMVQLTLGMDEPPDPQDASDALAVGICHLRHLRAAERVRLA